MPRILLGILSILIGLGSCVGIPILGLFIVAGDFITEAIDPPTISNQGTARLVVKEQAHYELFLIPASSTVAQVRDLPSGEYGLISADGTAYAAMTGRLDMSEFDSQGLTSVGGVVLEPGSYSLLAPDSEETLAFWPADMSFIKEAEDGTLTWTILTGVVFVLFLVVGILLIVSGAKGSRSSHQADYA